MYSDYYYVRICHRYHFTRFFTVYNQEVKYDAIASYTFNVLADQVCQFIRWLQMGLSSSYIMSEYLHCMPIIKITSVFDVHLSTYPLCLSTCLSVCMLLLSARVQCFLSDRESRFYCDTSCFICAGYSYTYTGVGHSPRLNSYCLLFLMLM